MFNEVSGLGLDTTSDGGPCDPSSLNWDPALCNTIGGGTGGYVCPNDTYNAGSVVSDPSQCGGTIGGGAGANPSYYTCPDGTVITAYPPATAGPSDCAAAGGGGGSTRPPIGGGTTPPSGGTSFWDALANLFKTGPAIASAATGNPLPGQLPAGYRASPYPGYVYGPTGALVPSSGISGGISLSPGGVGGSLNISPTLLIFGAVFLVIAMSGKR